MPGLIAVAGLTAGLGIVGIVVMLICVVDYNKATDCDELSPNKREKCESDLDDKMDVITAVGITSGVLFIVAIGTGLYAKYNPTDDVAADQ